MKRTLLLILMATSLFSCRRSVDDVVPDTLEGNWVMVAVKDKQTGLVHTKPNSITGEVEITFVAVNTERGFINGVTPTNTLSAEYTLGNERQISIPCVAATKVIETSWGLDFLYNVTTSHKYSFQPGNKLAIHTEAKTLYFKRN